jgi:L-histidine N-alpha-methyltransferase
MSRSPTAAPPEFYEAARRGLEAHPKQLPAVWLYDERGSQLYEEITRLPDYYPPRREAEILRRYAPEIARRSHARTLVELGAGNARNTRFLLDALAEAHTLERFVPVDVSEEMLRSTARTIAAAYPGIVVDEIVGDFERDLTAPSGHGPRLIALLGGTIGNLYPKQRAALLGTLARNLAPDDALLLSVDLVKEQGRLVAAYNDPTGVTEAFVRNALNALNRELKATFEQRRFVYEAFWDANNEWVDIGLRARNRHNVAVERLGLELSFESGEWLRVEVSSKFRREKFEPELAHAELRVESWLTDPAGDFAVVLARRED